MNLFIGYNNVIYSDGGFRYAGGLERASTLEILTGGLRMQKTGRLGRKATIQSYLMIAGTTLGLIIFVVIPLIWILRWCLFSYKGYGAVRFVWLDNFIRVFERSPKFWLSVKNTFVFAFGKLLIEIPLALVLAFILTRKLRGRNFFRSVFFMPSMLSVAVIGVILRIFSTISKA